MLSGNDEFRDFQRSLFWKIEKEGVIKVLKMAASSYNEKESVFNYPIHTVFVDDQQIVVKPNGYLDEIIITWDSLLSIRYLPGYRDEPRALSFRTFYGLISIIIDEVKCEEERI